MAETPLRLLAQDAGDVPVISALLQDMAVVAGDAHFDAPARRFVLLGNRYRWEAKGKTRVRSALTATGVLAAQRKGWPAGAGAVLDLLAIRHEGSDLLFDFAGGASVRLDIEAVDLVLEDLTGPWGAKTEPAHG